jgi:tetratricopeptide (TPR) repeat protein
MLRDNPSFPPHLQGLLLRHAARLALARGDSRTAVELATSSLACYDTGHRPDSETLPGILALAEAQNADRQYDAALMTAGRAFAVAVARLGGMTHSYNIGRAHLELGAAHAGLHDTESARAELEQALAHFRATVGLDAPPARRAQAELRRLD